MMINGKKMREVGSVTVYECDYKDLGVFRLNPQLNRPVDENDPKYIELIKSLKTVGQLEPIYVTKVIDENGKERLEISEGQHRYLALLLLEMPVKYILQEEIMPGCSTTDIVNAKSHAIPYTIKDFVGNGAARGIKVFEFIYKFKDERPNEISMSAILETVLTLVKLENASPKEKSTKPIYKNYSFVKACKTALIPTLESLGNLPFSDKVADDVDYYFGRLNKIMQIVDARKTGIGVNLNRAFLELFIGKGDRPFGLDDVLGFLMEDSKEAYIFGTDIRHAKTEGAIRMAFKEHQKDILKFVAKQGSNAARKNAHANQNSKNLKSSKMKA